MVKLSAFITILLALPILTANDPWSGKSKIPLATPGKDFGLSWFVDPQYWLKGKSTVWTRLLLNTLFELKFQTFHRLPKSVCIGNKYSVVTD